MTITKDYANRTISIAASGEIFITPNGIVNLDDPFYTDIHPIKKYQPERLKMFQVDPSDPDCNKLVDTWITSSELHTENLSAHNFSIHDPDDDPNKRTMYQLKFRDDLVPLTLLRDCKEGEHVVLHFDITLPYIDEADLDLFPTGTLTIDCVCSQMGYRYGWTTFEDMLGKLCSRM